MLHKMIKYDKDSYECQKIYFEIEGQVKRDFDSRIDKQTIDLKEKCVDAMRKFDLQKMDINELEFV